jgi:lysophospholipase L1-like esterase
MLLRDIALDGDEVEVRGAFELDRTPGGLGPRRLPGWTRPQLPDLFMETMVRLTAGVRLVFTSDTTSVEFVTNPTTIHIEGDPERPPIFQMLVDDVLQPDVVARGGTVVHIDDTRGPDGIRFEMGGSVTVRWEGLPAGTKRIEIWLPTNSSVELQALRVDVDATLARTPVTRRRWTHYGSSISHCMDVARPFDAWPAMVAAAHGLELTNVALAGQCQLDPFMGRVIRDAPADVISLKLGINLVNAASMTERTFGPAVHGLLDHIRDGHPHTPVLVVSPIICPIAEDHPGPTVPSSSGSYEVVAAPAAARPLGLTLRSIRRILADLVVARRAAGDDALHYLDGLSLFGEADAHLLRDGLHPSPEGYALLGGRFAVAAFGPDGPFAAS